MTITKKPIDGKDSITPIDKSIEFTMGSANLVPHSWYKLVVTSPGKPDFVGICILSELVYLYRVNASSKAPKSPKTSLISNSSFSSSLPISPTIYDSSCNSSSTTLTTSTTPTTSITPITSAPSITPIFSQQFSQVDNEFALNYKYFRSKFNLTYSQVKSALLRLEAANLVTRTFHKVKIAGRVCNNEMYLILHAENLLKLICDFEQKKFTGNVVKKKLGCEEISQGRYKNNKKEIKYRSSESKFLQNFGSEESENLSSQENPKLENLTLENTNYLKQQLKLENHLEVNSESANLSSSLGLVEEIKQVQPTANTNQVTASKKLPVFKKFVRKPLSEFYPLDLDDKAVLVNACGRDFSLNFINQLLLKLAGLYKSHGFYNKETVLKYLSKVLKHELRDAVKVGHESFKLKCNIQSFLSGTANSGPRSCPIEQEKYLEKIETSREISPAASLKRKIAGVFERGLAYELLAGASFKINSDSNYCEVVFDKTVSGVENIVFADYQQELFLSQVKAVYGDKIQEIKVTYSGVYQPYTPMVKNSTDSVLRPTLKQIQTQTQEIAPNITTKQTMAIDMSNYPIWWQKVRTKLIAYYGEAVDKSWFSKLIPMEMKENSTLMLKAPTHFIKGWLKDNYLWRITQFAKEVNYQNVEIIV